MSDNCQPPVDMPVALSIAGSDSGGGAGIQADLRAFAFFKVFGTTAITALTAQNPRGVAGVLPVSVELTVLQIRAVCEAFSVRAVKTGMLHNAAVIRAVAAELAMHPELPLVVDPVMIATSGARLLEPEAVAALGEQLLPRARVITPNVAEAEVLLGRAVSAATAVAAARDLAARFGCAVLLKGGHFRPHPGTDYLVDGAACWRLVAPDVAQPLSTHGTGCSLSAAMAAGLASGLSLVDAVRHAKAYVYGALLSAVRVGPDTYVMQSPARLPLEAVTCESAAG